MVARPRAAHADVIPKIQLGGPAGRKSVDRVKSINRGGATGATSFRPAPKTRNPKCRNQTQMRSSVSGLQARNAGHRALMRREYAGTDGRWTWRCQLGPARYHRQCTIFWSLSGPNVCRAFPSTSPANVRFGGR